MPDETTMGMKFEGLICSSCKTMIEGQNFFTCPMCQSIIHRNAHCEQIHTMNCPGRRFKRQFNPDVDPRPDVTDIFK